MRLVVDIECNSLNNPSKIWVVVAKDIDTGAYHVFKEPLQNEGTRSELLKLLSSATTMVGHNWLEYDYPNLLRLLGDASWADRIVERSVDTLVLSRLFNYQLGASAYADSGGSKATDLVGEDSGHVVTRSHSIEAYGELFKIPKKEFNDFTQYSDEMLEYCIRDVDICHRIYNLFSDRIHDPNWARAIRIEQEFQLVVNALHNNGFAFNTAKANKLLEQVLDELSKLDKEIADAFPPSLKLIKEITPRVTKFGTLNKADFRWIRGGDISEFNGGPFCRCEWQSFNPSSHKQIINVLSAAGWAPTDKTTTHIKTEREIRKIKNSKSKCDAKALEDRLETLKKTGWKVNETNLSTLPPSAPKPSRLLAKRILLESRRRTLVEWLSLVQEDGRIHGRFYGIGAWTHRMAHQQPNTANIPNEFDTQGNKKLLGKEMRSLWIAPKKRLLVGVDAEGIQLRIFAHYINDEEFTDALVKGKKSNKTDPHSLNQRILGSVCKSRAAAKRFIYALLLGAGIGKLSQVLECSESETKEALDRLLERYTGWARLKENDIPRDGKRGYFIGLDGRQVPIPGQSKSEREHLAMSGYLQNGEAVCMKLATLKFYKQVMLVNLVHDEWQGECENKMSVALSQAKLMDESLRLAGEELGLRCPLAGSYYNDDLRDYTIGTNWSVTH